jgi:uncharacterized SAM-binding protein YcdF (DUF218 family)
VQLSHDNEEGRALPEHELIRRVLLKRGVAADRIVQLPGECASTQDEARALARFLEQEPNATVAVVTHAFHTRRARILFDRILGERSSQVYFVGTPSDECSPDDWWQSEEGFVTYTLEYAKLLLAEVRR